MGGRTQDGQDAGAERGGTAAVRAADGGQAPVGHGDVSVLDGRSRAAEETVRRCRRKIKTGVRTWVQD